LVWKKLNLTQQKHAFANQNKCNSTQNKHKKLKLDLVAFYDIWPGNGASLFSKDKISQGGDKQGKSEEKRTSGKAYDINNIYSTKNKRRIKGALCPGACTGQVC